MARQRLFFVMHIKGEDCRKDVTCNKIGRKKNILSYKKMLSCKVRKIGNKWHQYQNSFSHWNFKTLYQSE